MAFIAFYPDTTCPYVVMEVQCISIVFVISGYHILLNNVCVYLIFTLSTEKRVAEDPELKGGPHYCFLSNSQKYANGVRKARLLVKKLSEYKLEDFFDAFMLRRYCKMQEFSAFQKENLKLS